MTTFSNLIRRVKQFWVNQTRIRRILIVAAIAVICTVVIAAVGLALNRTTKTAKNSAQKQASMVSWSLKKGKVWEATGTPPACPDPLVMSSPVDVSKVTAILYPGQPRGEAFKPHGAFRFSDPDNKAVVKVPMDAQLIRGSRAFRHGENQYAFEFIAPCGIWYSVGHLLELDPKFLAIANKLPLVQDSPDGKPALVQFYDIDPPERVTVGEVIATKVGYARDNNTVVDFGVLDLRKKNGVVLRPAWQKYSDQLDQYGICWLDLLPGKDRDRLRGLFGSGDSVTGTKSDYCHYSENL